MTSIDTRYSAVLPAQSELSDINGNGQDNTQIESRHGRAGNSFLANIDWSSLNKITSHETITIEASASRESVDETLDTLIDSVLLHIGTRVPG